MLHVRETLYILQAMEIPWRSKSSFPTQGLWMFRKPWKRYNNVRNVLYGYWKTLHFINKIKQTNTVWNDKNSLESSNFSKWNIWNFAPKIFFKFDKITILSSQLQNVLKMMKIFLKIPTFRNKIFEISRQKYFSNSTKLYFFFYNFKTFWT